MRWPPQCLPWGAYHTCTQRVCAVCERATGWSGRVGSAGRWSVGRSCDGWRRARESVVTWRVASGSRRAPTRTSDVRPWRHRDVVAIVCCRRHVDVVAIACCRRHVVVAISCCRRHVVVAIACCRGPFFCRARTRVLVCWFVGSVCSVGSVGPVVGSVVGSVEDGELAPRDVVSRMISSEMDKSGSDHVLLDISHRDADWLREVRSRCAVTARSHEVGEVTARSIVSLAANQNEPPPS